MNLQRLLVERMEHRILVGTVAFLGIMVLVGWIAINENGRMQAFQHQYEARAIERGASIFTASCAECHGEHGLGNPEVAPALNSPAFFGFDFVPDYHKELTILEQERTTLTGEEKALGVEKATEGTTADRITEIDTRTAAIQARYTEIDAREAEMKVEIAPIVQQLQPAIDKGYSPDVFSRLNQVGWGSTLHNFVYTTLIHGRPVSKSYWPRQMPTWGQIGGGPLRNDELEDLTAYVLNWDKGSEWTVEDLLAVQQFPKVPGQAGGTPAVENPIGVDTPTNQLVAGLADVTGDPQSGQALYTALACAGCHVASVVAPGTAGTWTRVNEVRLQDPTLAGYTGEQYLAESIIHPSSYVAPGFADGLMPHNFGEKLDYQGLADIIAYLKTQDQPSS